MPRPPQARKEVKRATDQVAHGRRSDLLRLGAIAAIAVALVVIVALVLTNPAIFSRPTNGVGLRVGQTAPDFSLHDVDGNVFTLSAQRGHAVLLDFMGSNCPTCVVQMPSLVSTYGAFAARGLRMISIDTGGSTGGSLGTTDPDVARAFLQRNGGTWPIALDDQRLGVTFQAYSLPTLYVIDRSGAVRFAHSGIADAGTLAGVIEPLL